MAPIEFLTDAERTRTDSLEALLRSAEGMGANGVVGLQFEASLVEDGVELLWQIVLEAAGGGV